jgi:murein DD-endopeptidase MepM/ murein hydrolase activator NlpD
MLTFVPGTMLAEVRPHSEELLKSLGRMLGQIDSTLQDFSHPAAQRELKWDLSAPGWIKTHLHTIADVSRRSLVEKFLAFYESEMVPALPNFRRSVIYGDANDHNVLVSAPWPLPRKAQSVIDFGDMHLGMTVSEVAIAAAYAMLGKDDVLHSVAAVVSGYHEAFPLQESEIAALYTLIGTRLAVSVTNSAYRQTLKPDDAYVTISEAPAWEALEHLAKVHPRFAHYTFRHACGLSAVPQSGAMRHYLEQSGSTAVSLLPTDIRTTPVVVFDLSAGSLFLGADPRSSETATLTPKISQALQDRDASIGVGRYNEARLLYTSPLFGSQGKPLEERRTVHLGMDFFAANGTAINAPLDGTVHILANNDAPLDYGPLVILKHDAGGAPENRPARHARTRVCAHRDRRRKWRLAAAPALSDHSRPSGSGCKFSRSCFCLATRGLDQPFARSKPASWHSQGTLTC